MAKTDSTFELARSILASIETNVSPALAYEEWLKLFIDALSKPLNEKQLWLLTDADCVMQTWLTAP